MRVAIVIAALVLGSIAFHLFSPWWQTPIASNWGSIDSALAITLWICAIAFVTLNLFMAYALMRYHHKPGNRAHYEPENTLLEKRLTFWTAMAKSKAGKHPLGIQVDHRQSYWRGETMRCFATRL